MKRLLTNIKLLWALIYAKKENEIAFKQGYAFAASELLRNTGSTLCLYKIVHDERQGHYSSYNQGICQAISDWNKLVSIEKQV